MGLRGFMRGGKVRTTSKKGIDFIVNEEGLVLRPYLDSVKKPTIGIGSTYWEDGRPVSMSDKPITRERAVALFMNTLRRYEAQVNASIKSNINQNQFDALVSLCYNIGTAGFAGATVVKRVNANTSDPEIRYWIEAWRNAGGKPILLGRRKREATLYFS
jgi:lysozyme